MLLRGNIYDAIRRSILVGTLRSGQDIREQVLAEQYNVSRSPIRDALLRLHQERLVTVLPRQGYRINPVTLADAEDLYDFRRVVDPACAAAAALRADDAGRQRLDDLRDGLTDMSDPRIYIRNNAIFHATVATLCGNPRMSAVARELAEQVERVQRAVTDTVPASCIEDFARQHVAIVDAIQAHDATAAHKAALAHVVDGRAFWVSRLRQHEAVQLAL